MIRDKAFVDWYNLTTKEAELVSECWGASRKQAVQEFVEMLENKKYSKHTKHQHRKQRNKFLSGLINEIRKRFEVKDD